MPVRINDIIEKLSRYSTEEEIELLMKAYVFSAQVHKGQKRKSGEPYLTHPLEVANILADLELDASTVCAGLLHDTIEDTLTTLEDIKREFGDEIAFLVDGVTKISKVSDKVVPREEEQAENLRKMMLSMGKDIRVILIKLADRLHNMKTLDYLDPEKRKEIARETIEIYAPLANRLGIYRIKQELEDLCLKHLHPEVYYDLKKKVAKKKRERDQYIEKVSKLIREELKKHGINAEVTGRSKHFYSIYQKMVKQGIDFSNVYDITAFRVIVDSVKDCYTVLGIIHSTWKPIPGRFKDYIAVPKSNLYQSLHTTVVGPYGERMEIQIRTWDMHRRAEYGIAAHWKYKEGKTSGGKDEEIYTWLKQVVDELKEVKDSNEFLELVKVDLFPDEVYVLTPKGDILRLPRGSTPVDFAYHIHSEVGHHCAGARVNGRMVPLDYELRNGDTVEIITSKDKSPSPDWLKFVKTSRAKTKIRQWIKKVEREKSYSIGKELLEKSFRAKELNFAKAMKDGSLLEVAEELNFKTVDDLIIAVGFGTVTPNQVVAKILKREEPLPKEGLLRKTVKKILKREDGIKVEGLDDIMVTIAKCCNPVPGDPIVGLITRGRGITVHARDCPAVLNYDPERRINVTWGKTDIPYEVRIKVVSEDRKGILAKISSTISDGGANITSAHASVEKDGKTAVQLFSIEVSDVKQLTKIMNNLLKVKGVFRVERVRS